MLALLVLQLLMSFLSDTAMCGKMVGCRAYCPTLSYFKLTFVHKCTVYLRAIVKRSSEHRQRFLPEEKRALINGIPYVKSSKV